MVTVFLCLLLSNGLDAQTFNNKTYNQTFIDVSSGLSNNYVSNIVEDNYGFKWIATEGGLNKYDGKGFEVFKPSNTPALENENIEVVYKDNAGNLWIGTKSGGLTYYDAISERFVNYNDQLFTSLKDKSVRINSITGGKDNKIFIGTWNNGLYIVDKNNMDSVVHYLKKSRISVLNTDTYGNVWIAEGENLLKYDPSEDRVIKIGSFGFVNSIYHDAKRKRLWLGINRIGVSYLDLNDYSYHTTSLIFERTFNIESLVVDDAGRVFVGTWGHGLFVSDTSASVFSKYSLISSSFASKNNNSSYETILDIHLDKNGIIWISTAFGGIVKMMPVNNFGGSEDFFETGSLSDYNIYALTVDNGGRTWIGTYGEGVSISENGNLRRLENIPVSKVNFIKQYGGYMFIGAREGLFRIEINAIDGLVQQVAILQNVTALQSVAPGKLWVGTQQIGLYSIENITEDLKESIVAKVKGWPGGDRVSEFEIDKEGNIWVGTFKGLYVYDAQARKFLSETGILTESLPSDIINDMFLDQETGKLWIALSGGLVELDLKGTSVTDYKVHGIENGLKNEFITSVIKGADGNIWMGTAYGLAKYIPKRQAFENFGEAEGVPVHSFNIKSVSQNKKNYLLFGATNGLTFFDPKEINFKQADPEVLFTTLSINGELIKVGEMINDRIIFTQSLQHTPEIEFYYEDKAISFTVATLDYLGDDNVLFSYRLVGFDDQWSQLSYNREIRFINLNAGTYHLEVKGSRDSFHWSAVASKTITINPPTWATWYAYVFYAFFVLGVAYLINFIARKQANLKAKWEVERIAREKQEDLSEAKMVFFTNISHEFRTPLTLILSPITELLMEVNVKGKVRERLTTVEKNASRLLDLINQLLDFRKSENGLLQLRVANGDFANFAREVFLSFKGHAKTKHIDYSFQANPKRIALPFDRDKMEIVLVNLLSNAFKYSENGGKIQLMISQQDNDCVVKVIDSGMGIKAEDIDKIFDRFYQIQTTKSAKIMGSGIGLSLAKNIVLLHYGLLNVTSVEGEGSTFTIHLPIENEGFITGEYISDFKGSDDRTAYLDSGFDTEDHLQVEPQINMDRPTILVVDDNNEIRSYLTELMTEDNYNVVNATNGVEALQVANEILPDLIISDVMMPEMDGITFCNTIKSDVSTSHIPVILLTARTSTVFEVSGLQTGAEDYIKKPFHPAVLKTRVASILENRAKIREYFVNKLRFEPGEQLEAVGTEEKFIQRAITLIEDHIHDAEFGIENLMDSLAMSKSTLYRKLKSLTGMSITGFIRSVKLKKAAELIISKNWKLNQVAYESGFNDYKYFKTCFQEHFGCLPSEYRAKKALENA